MASFSRIIALCGCEAVTVIEGEKEGHNLFLCPR